MYDIDKEIQQIWVSSRTEYVGWCTKIGFSASNKWKCGPRSPSGGIMAECSATPSSGMVPFPSNGPNSISMVIGRWIQTNSSSDTSSHWHPFALCKTNTFGCNSASLIYSVFWACQGDRRCFNEKEGIPFRQITMTTMNRRLSPEPRNNTHLFLSGNTQRTIESEH